jgi:ATP-dependent protease HslVU (ClpYQ) peptidase subunit
MSIVCCQVYDGKIEIASDSISVRHYTQSKGSNLKHVKLIQINGMTIGSVGAIEESSLFFQYCSTRKPRAATEQDIMMFLAEFSEWKKKLIDNNKIENSYILAIDKKAFVIEGFLVQEISQYEAIGAGMDYALAAMYLGHDVKKAVEVACELSVWCEKPIRFFEV